MMNFEAKYPVEGTAALNPCYKGEPTQGGVIIAFPGKSNMDNSVSSSSKTGRLHPKSEELSMTPTSVGEPSFASELRQVARLFGCNDFAANLCHGNMQGESSGRLQRWQVVAAICLFSALAFATLFL